MNISDYVKHDAVALSKLIKHGEVTVNELIDAAFSRLEEVNPELNAVIRQEKSRSKLNPNSLTSDTSRLPGCRFF